MRDVLHSKNIAGAAHDCGHKAISVQGRNSPCQRGKVVGKCAMSGLSRIFDFADIRQCRQTRPDELRWEDASTLFTLAAAFAVATLCILTLIG